MYWCREQQAECQLRANSILSERKAKEKWHGTRVLDQML